MTLKKIAFHAEAVNIAIIELRDAALECCALKGQKHAVGSICTAIATLIAGAGAHGSTEQLRVMDLANSHGFRPEYYGGGIRVEFDKEHNAAKAE